MGRLVVLSLVVPLLAVGIFYLLTRNFYRDPTLTYKRNDQPWGRSDSKQTAVTPFTVKVSEQVLADLKSRLDSWKPPTPTIEGVGYTYGLPSQTLEKVIKYWRESYDWKKAEVKLNSLPQFQTVINGLNIHFLHVKGDPTAKIRVPLLMVHGWPGSVVEFYKVIPLLTAKKNDLTFDVVAPSIPGYGFSEAAVKPGFSVIAAAEIFESLMSRLGYERFVYQGGDWGGVIGGIVSAIFPDKVIGYHTNFAQPPGANAMQTLHLVAAAVAPSLVIGKEEAWKLSTDKLKWLMEESGYFHEHSTKPDTVGVGLSDSPVGLAAWILEKFATWAEHVEFKSGKGLSNEEIITNIMVYWITNHITSSIRLYKETMNSNYLEWLTRSYVNVPTAVACYPGEALCIPTSLLKRQMPRLVHHSDMPRGGHFAAFEQPDIFADDLRKATIAFIETRKEQDKWGAGLGLGI